LNAKTNCPTFKRLIKRRKWRYPQKIAARIAAVPVTEFKKKRLT